MSKKQVSQLIKLIEAHIENCERRYRDLLREERLRFQDSGNITAYNGVLSYIKMIEDGSFKINDEMIEMIRRS